MNLLVQRIKQTRRSTTGKLSIDDMAGFVTLEPPKEPDPNGNGYVCIPAGTYPLTIRWSPRFARQVPHVEKVPGRTDIELHVLNWPDQTEGCTGIGRDFGTQPDFISHSSASFAALMTILYSKSLLTNPGSPEMYQVWDCGTITYQDPLGG